ncbi:Uncharacterised protein [Amycolatopsis camponoti]|uniref:Uncharacterized protein n=1 Tax=Amycolatopsis camponoti TaxID=2606593 RepID=A0A6I8LM54_9PSEU|nr:Uncharacterised protein [Amycolatopsis camponoti]
MQHPFRPRLGGPWRVATPRGRPDPADAGRIPRRRAAPKGTRQVDAPPPRPLWAALRASAGPGFPGPVPPRGGGVPRRPGGGRPLADLRRAVPETRPAISAPGAATVSLPVRWPRRR